jgi:hypothetical protein
MRRNDRADERGMDVANFADHELLQVHEVLMDLSLSAKEIQNHRQAVRDPALSQLVSRSLQQKHDFVNRIRQILG